jgi:hypothetical protein
MLLSDMGSTETNATVGPGGASPGSGTTGNAGGNSSLGSKLTPLEEAAAETEVLEEAAVK